jgi:hypothetical protein
LVEISWDMLIYHEGLSPSWTWCRSSKKPVASLRPEEQSLGVHSISSCGGFRCRELYLAGSCWIFFEGHPLLHELQVQ